MVGGYVGGLKKIKENLKIIEHTEVIFTHWLMTLGFYILVWLIDQIKYMT